MGFIRDERERICDSPYVDLITQGWTAADGTTTRPAESAWHMVLVRFQGQGQLIFTGPLTTSGTVHFVEGAEILWIRFALGTYMPHLPLAEFLDRETPLPAAASRSFWLNGSAWQFPDFDNADTFIDRLVRENVLMHDPLVSAALRAETSGVSPRTLRHRFLHATGVTRGHVRQVERAKRAADLLRQGHPILDTVAAAGYFDQPHLTRSLKQWVGYTPPSCSAPASALAILYKTVSFGRIIIGMI